MLDAVQRAALCGPCGRWLALASLAVRQSDGSPNQQHDRHPNPNHHQQCRGHPVHFAHFHRRHLLQTERDGQALLITSGDGVRGEPHLRPASGIWTAALARMALGLHIERIP